MPNAPLRYCLQSGCPNRVQKGRCPEHSTQQRRAVNVGQHHALYRQVRWLRLRDAILRETPFCRDCETRLAEEVHHRTHRESDLSLFYDRSNLVPLCRPCHAVRTRRGE